MIPEHELINAKLQQRVLDLQIENLALRKIPPLATMLINNFSDQGLKTMLGQLNYLALKEAINQISRLDQGGLHEPDQAHTNQQAQKRPKKTEQPPSRGINGAISPS